MLVIVAIKAEIFPVAASDGLLSWLWSLWCTVSSSGFSAVKARPQRSADPGMKLERLLAVARHARVALACALSATTSSELFPSSCPDGLRGPEYCLPSECHWNRSFII